MKRNFLVLLLIIFVAVFLRLYKYDFADVITDEVFYGYRSIGLIDSLNSPWQPTPFEWYETVPSWAKLSFHDHPPLLFWIQHWFFKIFGVNLLGMRLLSILAGIISVWLTYEIAKKLFVSEKIALLSAAILAINPYHVWVSKIGIQESVVIMMMLLAVWLFLKTLEQTRYYYLAVIAAGFAILTKYTAFILLPIFGIYLLWRHRGLLSWRRLVLAAILLLLILSPVIIYNLKLYAARGHFDYQLSYLLKQNVPEWQIRPGREMPGGFADRFSNLFVKFFRGYGPVFSLITAFAIFLFLLKRTKTSGEKFLALIIGLLLLLFFVIGPEERFMPMVAPFLAMMIAGLVLFPSFFPLHKGESKRGIQGTVLIIFLILELAYTANSFFTLQPRGREVSTYSRLRRDSNAWGYNQLEKYLLEEMKDFYPAQIFPLRFGFAKGLQREALARAKTQNKKPRSILFVSDSNLYGVSSLWYITRHTVYDGWTMITDASYLEAVKNDPEHFREQGIEEVVFIKGLDTLLRIEERSSAGEELENFLTSKGFKPTRLIKAPSEKIAFKIYKF